MNPMMAIGSIRHMLGLRVISSTLVPRFKMVQYRFPKTKKARIKKKWAKNPANFKQVPIKNGYVLNGKTLVVHPDDLTTIRQVYGIIGV